MRSSLLDDSVFPLPQPDSWTSIDHQYVNGEKQANIWGETEVQINQTPPKEGRDSPEEAEQWEQIMWPVRPMSCISPPLSFATVQWDMPDLTAEASSLRTDNGTANELGSGAVTSVDSTSPSLYQLHHVNAEPFREEEGGIDSQLVSSDSQKTGNDFEVCAKCEERCKQGVISALWPDLKIGLSALPATVPLPSLSVASTQSLEICLWVCSLINRVDITLVR